MSTPTFPSAPDTLALFAECLNKVPDPQSKQGPLNIIQSIPPKSPDGQKDPSKKSPRF